MNYQRVSDALESDHPLLFYHAVAYDHFFRISEVVAYEIFDCILSTTTKISFSFPFQSFPTVFCEIFSNTTRANHKIKFLWEKAKHKSVYILVLPWVSRARKNELIRRACSEVKWIFQFFDIQMPFSSFGWNVWAATYISRHCNVSSLVTAAVRCFQFKKKVIRVI